jgi:hypothetical protein
MVSYFVGFTGDWYSWGMHKDTHGMLHKLYLGDKVVARRASNLVEELYAEHLETQTSRILGKVKVKLVYPADSEVTEVEIEAPISVQ